MDDKRPVGRGRGSRPPLTGGQPVRPAGVAPFPAQGPSAPPGLSAFPPLGGGGGAGADEKLRVSF